MLGGKFLQAISYSLKKKVKLPTWFYKDIETTTKAESVAIAGLAQVEQVKFVMAQLQNVLDNDGNFDDFQKMVDGNEVDITLPKHRLDNIYRTNIQMAYSYGRYQQQQANKKNKPYLMYSAVNDSRTRPTHRALHGTIRPIDDPFWLTHTPPSDYRCRCHTVALTEAQAKSKGVTPVADLPKERLNPEFDFNPKEYGRRGDKLIADLPLNDVKVIGDKPTKETKSIWGNMKDRLKEAVKWAKIAKIMLEN